MDARKRTDATRSELVQMDATRIELMQKDAHGREKHWNCDDAENTEIVIELELY